MKNIMTHRKLVDGRLLEFDLFSVRQAVNPQTSILSVLSAGTGALHYLALNLGSRSFKFLCEHQRRRKHAGGSR